MSNEPFVPVEPTVEPPSEQQPRRVNAGAVVGGVFVALITGVVVIFGSFIAGIALDDAIKSAPLPAIVAVLIPVAIYGGAYLLFRRGAPDFARGLFIGACIVVILGGICNASIVSSFRGGFH